MAKPLSEPKRHELARQAQILRAQDLTQRQIAVALGVSQPTVCNWLRKPPSGLTLQTRIAEKIRAELVCCDIAEQMKAVRGDVEATQRLRESNAFRGHEICYYGEWAARIAEQVN